MADKIRIAVIFGGRSGEHEVSLLSARSVLSVLDPSKYEVTQIGITSDGRWFAGEDVLDSWEKKTPADLLHVALLPEPGENTLYAMVQTAEGQTLKRLLKIDVAFPVLHGTFGEDGTMQGLLELADVAYIGAGVLASSVGMDKALFKNVMRSQHLPVLEAITLTRHQVESDIEFVVTLSEMVAPYPLFTKPVNLGSSVGIKKCHNRTELITGLHLAARYDRRILVERGLEAPHEIEVSVLGNDDPIASIPGEVVPSDEFYSYHAKYEDEGSQLLIPAPLPAETIAYLQQTAVDAFRAVDGAGMARVDFLMDRTSGEIFLSEINTIPGFTKISMYPKLWGASGLPYAELVDRLIELAIQRKADRDRTERQYGREE
jgi:D-alanine-D-alanine ligase